MAAMGRPCQETAAVPGRSAAKPGVSCENPEPWARKTGLGGKPYPILWWGGGVGGKIYEIEGGGVKNVTFLREGVLFCYLLAIFVGIAGITMVFLAGKKQATQLNKALKLFLVGMLIMSLYDLLLYYTGYVLGDIQDMLALRIGSCIIAILFYLWLHLQQKIADTDQFAALQKGARLYIFIYAALWFFSTIIFTIKYFYALRWLLLVTDIILILILLVGSVVYISKCVLEYRPKLTIYYMIIVTAMLVWNYASYFWGEASVYWGNSKFIREPLDLTIIFWFVVNIATVIFIYRTDFQRAFGEDSEASTHKEFNLEQRMEAVAEEYELTSREKDLARLIYEGKSNSQIAEMRYISESTVKTHVYNIFRKMEVKNRMGVTCIIREGKIPEESER